MVMDRLIGCVVYKDIFNRPIVVTSAMDFTVVCPFECVWPSVSIIDRFQSMFVGWWTMAQRRNNEIFVIFIFFPCSTTRQQGGKILNDAHTPSFPMTQPRLNHTHLLVALV